MVGYLRGRSETWAGSRRCPLLERSLWSEGLRTKTPIILQHKLCIERSDASYEVTPSARFGSEISETSSWGVVSVDWELLEVEVTPQAETSN